jgi:hypothetical protein
VRPSLSFTAAFLENVPCVEIEKESVECDACVVNKQAVMMWDVGASL